MTWERWLNAVLGLWLIVSPFLGFAANAMMINLVVVGLVLAAVNLFATATGQIQRRAHM
ncbi:SPW repeat protein [Candidatus Giovannonibacteria bacterium]|nr:SPW repeat protein [Candidatus Giovannonibacteria bacterium]